MKALFVLAVLCLAPLSFPVIDNGQWDDVPGPVRDWFKSVRSPNGVPCCDISDGHPTQYDIRPDGYWIPDPMDTSRWIPVPSDIVIHGVGNPVGEAIIWWVMLGNGTAHLRCFVPGGGV